MGRLLRLLAEQQQEQGHNRRTIGQGEQNVSWRVREEVSRPVTIG
jgi:hypothetical protein